MKKILMLGSSHAACFSRIDPASDFQLSIAANQGSGLFKNLQIDKNGVLSCHDENKEWNNIVFDKSLGDSSRCIYDYDSIILNVRLRCNLPEMFNRDVARSQPIHTYSLGLVKCVVENSLTDDAVGIKGSRRLISRINSSGYQGSILLMVTPFTTSINQDLIHDESRSEGCKRFLLDFVSLGLGRELGVEVLLPSTSMIDSHLFVHGIYAAGPESAWKDRPESQIKKDFNHKNRRYALDLLRTNAGKLGISPF